MKTPLFSNQRSSTRSMKVTTASVSPAKSPSRTVVSGTPAWPGSLVSCTLWRTCSIGRGAVLRFS